VKNVVASNLTMKVPRTDWLHSPFFIPYLSLLIAPGHMPVRCGKAVQIPPRYQKSLWLFR
jgi:hypothetical protein